MMYYTKDDVKKEYDKSVIRINTLFGACGFYLLVFIINLLGYDIHGHEFPHDNIISYAVRMTGAYVLIFSLLIPVILHFYQKRLYKNYRSEMNLPGSKIFYSGGSE
jgi:hypothetical protein